MKRYTKLSITLEEDVARELRRVAGVRGVSAYINASVRQHLQSGRLRALLDEMERDAGPIPDEIRRHVDELPWPE